MTDQQRAHDIFEAASAAHQLERSLLSLAESIRRGEAPDPVSMGNIAVGRARIDALISFAFESAA